MEEYKHILISKSRCFEELHKEFTQEELWFACLVYTPFDNGTAIVFKNRCGITGMVSESELQQFIQEIEKKKLTKIRR